MWSTAWASAPEDDRQGIGSTEAATATANGETAHEREPFGRWDDQKPFFSEQLS
jgi:hypothetical protein